MDGALLDGIGLSILEEGIYRLLLESPPLTVREIGVTRDGAGDGEVRKALQRLESAGLVSRSATTPTRFVPAPPDAAIQLLVLQRMERLEAARLAAAELAQTFRGRRERDPGELIELVVGLEGVGRQFEQLERSASDEVVLFDTPPYISPRHSINALELETLARGVRYRTIYSRSALEHPGAWEHVRAHTEAGEEARMYPELPMKLAIADRKLGLLPLSMDEAFAGAVLIRSASFVAALVTLFDALWERATPILPDGTKTPADELLDGNDREILSLLALGLKDETIARQLGMGLRTLARRTSSLMAKLGATTRFEAGLRAASLGIAAVPQREG